MTRCVDDFRTAERHDAEVGPPELEKSSGTLAGGIEIRKTDSVEGAGDLFDRNAADTSTSGEEAALGADYVPSGEVTA